MSDTVFKQPVTQPSESVIEAKTPVATSVTNVEPPFLDYQMSHGNPYTVDYFQLGNTWNDLQGGFPKEIGRIESYISEKVNTGELPNDTKSIKQYLGKLEKLTNVKDEPRAVIKIETLASYIKFLQETDARKTNLRRLYG